MEAVGDLDTVGCCLCLFFFFSSRRRHTRSLCDWSSDVCSSDLVEHFGPEFEARLFPYRKEFLEADIPIVDAGPVDRVAAGVSKSAGPRGGEAGREIGRASCRERV